MLQDDAVGRRLRVMELVDDGDVEGAGRDGRDAVGVQGLDRGEDVPPPLRTRTPDVQLTESAVAQHLPVNPAGLLQDLLPVCDEQQAGPVGRGGAQPPVVQRGDHGLAGAGGRDEQVPVPVVHLPLHRQRVEHGLLVRVRPNLNAGQRNRRRARPAARRRGECVVEPVAVALRLVGFETLVVPVAVEGGGELLQQYRGGHPG